MTQQQTTTTLSESQTRVLMALEQSEAITYEELADKAGLSYDGVRGRVSELINKDINIQKVKDGRYTKLKYEKPAFEKRNARKIKAPTTYGDLVGSRMKTTEDFAGVAALLAELTDYTDLTNKPKARKFKNKCGVLLLSDLHFGEIIRQNGEVIYNTDTAFERMDRLTVETIKKMEDYDMSQLYIALIGDTIDGDTIYKNQAFNIEKPAIEQIQDATRALVDMLTTFSNEGLEVEVGCVRGNHGITNYKNVEADNWDNVVYEMLNIAFRHNDNITISHYSEDQAKVQVLDKNIVLWHGEKMSDQIKTSAGLKTFRGMCGKHKLKDGDMIVIGHLHTFGFEEDHSKFLVRNGALVDTSEYAQKLNMYSEPMQTFMMLQEGKLYPTVLPIEVSD